MYNQDGNYIAALEDFRQARRRAMMEQLLGRVFGRSTELLQYEDVARQLKVKGQAQAPVQDIPLDAIVGSVGRYSDFTRSFLPRRDSALERWARVKMATEEMAGLPPIEVYKLGDAYFVLDGNHRVSVARQLGARHIQAYVTEILTRVPLEPGDQPDDLILKAEYADFLDKTHLDDLRPGANLRVTLPGGYPELLTHIEVHRYFMGIERQREIPYDEAVAHWYDTVYLPLVEAMRSHGLLRGFSNRTEADLYLWVMRHRLELQEELGLDIRAENVASGLAPRPAAEKAQSAALWTAQPILRPDDAPIDILVPISGEEIGWTALEQAIVIGQRNRVRLQGLHVVASAALLESPETQAVKSRFEQRIREAGIEGRLGFAVGEVSQEANRRARWSDLIVVNLAYPPGAGILDRLKPGFRQLLRQAAWPVLVVPSHTSPLTHPLLAFDGSPAAVQALYFLTYVAGSWSLPVTVLSVADGDGVSGDTQRLAKDYLYSHGVAASYVVETGPVAPAILRTVEAHECDCIAMGGYDRSRVAEVVSDSVVDQVLRTSWWPILIVR